MEIPWKWPKIPTQSSSPKFQDLDEGEFIQVRRIPLAKLPTELRKLEAQGGTMAYPIGSMYAAIHGNMDPINIPLYVSMYTSTMDPMAYL